MMQAGPTKADILSINDFKELLFALYVRDRQIAVLQAELAKLKSGIPNLQEVEPRAE